MNDIIEEDISVVRSSKSCAPKCWGKRWFITVTVIAWILGSGAFGIASYCGINAKSAVDEYENIKSLNDHVVKEISETQAKISELNRDIQKIIQEIANDTKSVDELEIDYQNIKADYDNLTQEYGKYRETQKKVLSEIEDHKREITKLTTTNKELTEKNQNLTKDIEILERNITTYGQEANVFKISTLIMGAGFIGSVVDFFITGNKLQQLDEKLKKYNYYLTSFNNVAKGEIYYELLRRSTKKHVERKNCFSGTDKQRLSDCAGKSPTITTVFAKGGYRFGAVLHISWDIKSGDHKDDKAFTYSDYRGRIAGITANSQAMIVGDDILIQFGEGETGKGDIRISLDGHGTINEKSYPIPDPYNQNNFYVDGNQFTIEKVEVDFLIGLE